MTSRLCPVALLCLAAAISCGGEGGQDEAAPSEASPPGSGVPAAGADTLDPRARTLDTTAGADTIDTTARADSAGGAGPMIHPLREPDTAATRPVVDGSLTAAGPDTSWTIEETFAPPTVAYAPLPVLSVLRTGTHAEYERFTLELGGADGLPSYHLEYVDRPLQECGSGRQISPIGDAWLQLRLEPAAAHTEAGQPTLGAREIAVGAPLLRRIYRTCDFEGVVTLVLALSAPKPFRVLTLSDPWRIVVDIQR